MNVVSEKNWWGTATIYQIYLRSFRDINGDGYGDVAGVIEKLPYLVSLGIDAIWITPFYNSPDLDGGYDISDPRSVDPKYGTLSDVEKLIATAHGYGLKIILDIVPNHFSTKHIWFETAVQSPKGSRERSRFHFYDGRGEKGEIPPNNWNSVFGGPAWTQLVEKGGNKGQWYLHLFDSSQADLNWDNNEVRSDFESTLKFWLDRDVDGFRIDVAHGLIKEKIELDHQNPEMLSKSLRIDFNEMDSEERAKWLTDIPFFDRNGVHEIFESWRKILDSYSGSRMSVGEVFVYPPARLSRYVRSNELHQVFNFDFLLIDWSAERIKEAISQSLLNLSEVKALPTWAMNNHDSMRVVSRLGSEARARALALVVLALPGCVYIYQGEELGLPDGKVGREFRKDPIYIRSKGKELGRDSCRIPIPWEINGKNFGFGNGIPWLPQPQEYGVYSVDVQEENVNSFLHFYRKSISLRKHLLVNGDDLDFVWRNAPAGVIYFLRGSGIAAICNTNNYSVVIYLNEKWKIVQDSGVGSTVENGELNLKAETTVWLSTKVYQD